MTTDTPTSPPLYQGTDWFTSRESVADAFDLLDQMSELCFAPVKETAAEGDDDTADETMDDIFIATFLDLCEGLISALLSTEADMTLGDASQAFSLRWRLFEARLIVLALGRYVATSIDPPPAFFETCLFYMARVKSAIKAVDN